MLIRPATINDVDSLARVERLAWASVSEDAVAPAEIIRERIELCNSGTYPWFLLAEQQTGAVPEILAYVALQPTRLTPDAVSSWDAATDDGTLRNTFDQEGQNLFAVSLSVPKGVPPGTAELLVCQTLVYRLAAKKKHYMFCARMPGFRAAKDSNPDLTAESYLTMRRSDETSVDWQIREYENMFGEPALRVIRNGFPPDADSCGHSVFFAANDPVKNLETIISRLYRAGIAAGRKMRKTKGRNHLPNNTK
jgi:hypothetical protein